VRETVHAGSWYGILSDKRPLGVDLRIFKGLFKKYDSLLDWIDLAQDRDK
jgi:hypothetical protein